MTKELNSLELDNIEDLEEEEIVNFFSVNWIELEILKILSKSPSPVYKGEMITLLRSKHTEIMQKPESSFYAIFDKLENLDFVRPNSIPGKGYKSFLEITQRGMLELRRALYWAISTIFEGMTGELIHVLNDLCIRNMGCLKEMYFGIVSPNNPEFLVPEMCNDCINASDEEIPHRFNILMPYAKDTLVPYYQNLKSVSGDIPLKERFLDRVMSILTLGLIEPDESADYLREVYRILKPEGKLAVVELTTFKSYLFDSLQKLTNGFSSFIPKKKGNGFLQFDPLALQKQIAKIFGKKNVIKIDMREFVLIVAKKPAELREKESF
ncbi:MAG: class I SAM-dependent methyltransferase [Candidatus Heimdallarchaeota archaeon]